MQEQLQILQRHESIVKLAELLCSLTPLHMHAGGQALCEHSIRQMALALEPRAEPGQ
jgi:hypothetical protein